MNLTFKTIILTILVFNLGFGARASEYLFETIDISDGLSQNSVTCVAKDKYGFIWIGTEDGLDRFDGINFKEFRYDAQDTSSINSNTIVSSLIDSQGDLWVGTYMSGLNRYDYETERFIRYSDSGFTKDGGQVYSLLEDKTGYIWIGTTESGVYRLDPKTGKIIALDSLITNSATVSDVMIGSLFVDHQQNLWISTSSGLNVLNLGTYELRSYFHDEDDPSSIFDNNVNAVYETYDGNNYRLWVGTNWGGFDYYNPENDIFVHCGLNSDINPDYPETGILCMLQENEGSLWLGTDSEGILMMSINGKLMNHEKRKIYDETALKDDIIRTLYDDGDIIWIGTSGGVSKYARNRKKFYNLSNDPLDPEGLHDNRILQLRFDNSDRLWIATWTAGLSRYTSKTNRFEVFKHDPADTGSISDNSIQDILVDRNDNLWVISESASIDLLRAGSNTFEHFSPKPGDPNWLQSEYLLTLLEDHNGLIWIGSWDDGLISLDPNTMHFTTYREPAVKNITLGSIAFYCTFEDSKGTIWIGAESDGLVAFDREKQTLKQYLSNPNDPNSLPYNDVLYIYEDSEGYLWLATYGGGLSKFDPVNEIFENYGKAQGLLNESIYAIFEDSNKYLWMSTNNGLARFDKIQKLFRNYNTADGVLSKEFNPAACMDDKGWLYFGGIKGITYFNPVEIEDNRNPPTVQFTELSIMNQPISTNQFFNGRTVLDRTITERPLVELFPEDLFFSLRFASLDYYHAKSNEYAYLLEGFDDEWRYIGNRQNITFTNLPPGDYKLHVKGSNNDDVWNDELATLPITVHPEFWETWWFTSGVILSICVAIFIAYRMRTAFLISRAKELERHNIQLNAEIESRREAHRLARERADYFRAVISQSPIPMAIHDIDGHITHLNNGWVNLWGLEGPEDIIRDYQIETDPLAQKLNLYQSFKKALLGNIVEHPEVQYIAQDGDPRMLHILLYPLKETSGTPNQVMISIEDVSIIVKHRNLLQKSLGEKDLLLKEVHHRVKNNLQIIASLLGLQMASIDDKNKIQTLEDFRNRVNSMAQVHDALYRSPDFDNIDIATYIERLIDDLHKAFKTDNEPIKIVTDIPAIKLSVDIAVPCGLIINELVTNALKYAFPDGSIEKKQIIIRFQQLENDFLRLDVSDNGVGFQHPVQWESVKSLGLFLVKILSEQQLMGSAKLKDETKAHF
ncbi:PAS domain S-box protein, partial [bacterium]|nr:PAS domain S-box protein [bacterium]